MWFNNLDWPLSTDGGSIMSTSSVSGWLWWSLSIVVFSGRDRRRSSQLFPVPACDDDEAGITSTAHLRNALAAISGLCRLTSGTADEGRLLDVAVDRRSDVAEDRVWDASSAGLLASSRRPPTPLSTSGRTAGDVLDFARLASAFLSPWLRDVPRRLTAAAGSSPSSPRTRVLYILCAVCRVSHSAMTSARPPTAVADKSGSNTAERSLVDDVIESRDLATSGDVSGSSLSEELLSGRP